VKYTIESRVELTTVYFL